MPTERWDLETTAALPVDLEVTFRTTGHHVPAYVAGAWAECTPLDHEDEREVIAMSIAGVELPKEVVEKLTEVLRREIDSEPLENCY